MNILHYLDTDELLVFAPANEYVSLGEKLIKGAENICLQAENDGGNLHDDDNLIRMKALQCKIDPSHIPERTIKFAIESGALVISGDLKGLRIFAQNLIIVFTKAEPGTHEHFDDLCPIVSHSECDSVVLGLP